MRPIATSRKRQGGVSVRGSAHEPEIRDCLRLLERLSQPSSAAGMAALLACWCRSSPSYAPAIVDLVLTVIAIGAALRDDGQVRMPGLQRPMTATLRATGWPRSPSG